MRIGLEKERSERVFPFCFTGFPLRVIKKRDRVHGNIFRMFNSR